MVSCLKEKKWIKAKLYQVNNCILNENFRIKVYLICLLILSILRLNVSVISPPYPMRKSLIISYQDGGCDGWNTTIGSRFTSWCSAPAPRVSAFPLCRVLVSTRHLMLKNLMIHTAFTQCWDFWDQWPHQLNLNH